jgi:hypothetical protein
VGPEGASLNDGHSVRFLHHRNEYETIPIQRALENAYVDVLDQRYLLWKLNRIGKGVL